MADVHAVYAHFPWCVKKCPYCDFNSHPLREHDDFAAYSKALQIDTESQLEYLDNVRSIFLGGGTPSLFAPEYMAQFLARLPLAADCEITMEANPGTTEHANFAAYRDAGVNRLSIGAQSFQDARLAQLGRIHCAAETRAAFTQARQAGFERINVDLMWGLPDQDVAAALQDLHQAIALGADHISWYQLTIEPKTEFAQRPPLLPVDATLAEIEAAGLASLADAGYQRYEVSAFAKPNQQCQHNLNYWQFGDYVGLGAGAHGKITTATGAKMDIQRTRKASQPRRFQNEPDTTTRESVAWAERPLEFMMNVLRLVDGVEQELFAARTGIPWQEIAPLWGELCAKGLVQQDRCATTPLGLRYLDSVLAEFLRA